MDLADDEGAPTVDPYSYGVASTSATHTSPDMSQHHSYGEYGATLSPGAAVTASHSGTSESNYYAGAEGLSHATSSSAGYAGRGAGAAGVTPFPTAQVAGGPSQPVPGNVYDPATAGMSAKQMEAYQESQRFHIQNQPNSPTYGGPSLAGPSDGITVHQDGGAFEEEAATGNEIPPTYDSLSNSRLSNNPHSP